MKIAIITDTHFGIRNDHETFVRHMEMFLSNVFFPTLKQRGITDVWHLGDLFDRRKYVNFKTLYNARRIFFDRLREDGCVVDLTLGNHDTYHKNHNTINSPKLLASEYDNITIHERPVEKQYDGVNVLLMPWICPDTFEQSMDMISTSNARVLAGHLELQGFEWVRGHESHVGFEPSIVSNFELVLTGHYHHKSSRDNVHYLGSPAQFTWGDYGDQRGFHIFDTETMDLEFIANPYVTFKKVFYDDTQDSPLSGDISAIDQVDQLNDCYTKVVVVNKQNSFKFDTIYDKIEKSGAINLTIDDGMQIVFDADVQFEHVEDTVSVLQKYITHMDTKADKKQLEQFMFSLYNEALAVE